jgi:hypothetical protein
VALNHLIVPCAMCTPSRRACFERVDRCLIRVPVSQWVGPPGDSRSGRSDRRAARRAVSAGLRGERHRCYLRGVGRVGRDGSQAMVAMGDSAGGDPAKAGVPVPGRKVGQAQLLGLRRRAAGTVVPQQPQCTPPDGNVMYRIGHPVRVLLNWVDTARHCIGRTSLGPLCTVQRPGRSPSLLDPPAPGRPPQNHAPDPGTELSGE